MKIRYMNHLNLNLDFFKQTFPIETTWFGTHLYINTSIGRFHTIKTVCIEILYYVCLNTANGAHF